MNIFCKNSRIKQYMKDSRALRIETVVNDACGFGCGRLLHAERAGQGCVLADPVFERIAHPSVTVGWRRAPAMRFGDPQVPVLAGALCSGLGAATGITSRSLRALMTGLPGVPCSMTQACYDLAQPRRNGLIARRPPRARHRYAPP